jgi:hypothetical protein
MRCGHYMTLAPGVGGAFLGPSPSAQAPSPELPLTPRAQSFAAATTPAKVELSLDQVG